MSIFWHAFGDFIPKALGMGTVALFIAVATHRTNVKIAEKERARLFKGNREEAEPWTH